MKDDPKEDLKDACLQLLGAQEEKERLTKALAKAKENVRWCEMNVAAATRIVRGDRGTKLDRPEETHPAPAPRNGRGLPPMRA